jgi:hypothetical protein
MLHSLHKQMTESIIITFGLALLIGLEIIKSGRAAKKMPIPIRVRSK